jgi:PA14 domain
MFATATPSPTPAQTTPSWSFSASSNGNMIATGTPTPTSSAGPTANNIVNLVQQKISGPAKSFNDTHFYQSFEMDIQTANNVFGKQTANPFGVITIPDSTGTTDLQMVILDDNLYDQTSAQYAIESFYTQKLWEQHDYFNTNKSSYTISPGLQYNIYDQVMVSPNNSARTWDFNYFSKQIRDSVKPLSSGTSNDMSSLKSATAGFSLSSVNTNFYIEWFGYFCPKTNGLYGFQITSPDIVNIWVGDIALTDFTLDNVSQSNQKIPMTGGAYYPIRIQYGMGVTSVVQNLQLKISVFLNGDFLTNGTGYFFSIFDKMNTPYEPIQLHYALTQYTPTSIASSLYNVYYTKINTVNNSQNNQALRNLKSSINTVINSVIIAQCTTTDLPCTFSIQDDGNAVLSNSSSSVQITHFTSQTAGVNFSHCKGGVDFKSVPVITLNGYSINQYYTIVQENRIDTATGLSYVNYNFKNFNYTGGSSDPLYSVINGNLNTNFTLEVNYTLGSEQLTDQYVQPLTSVLDISNLKKIADCTFVMELVQGGDITLRNYNQTIWNLFGDTMNTSSVQKIKQVITKAIANQDWVFEYQTAYNKGVNMSYLFQGESLDTNTFMYTADGMCKLSVQGNQLVLNVLTPPIQGRTYTDNTDSPGTFYLFSAIGDMKFNTNMLVDTSNSTLQYVPVGGNILKYRQEFQAPLSNQYSFPPFSNGNNLADGYALYNNTDVQTCQSNCVMNPTCNHFYSYQSSVDGTTGCVINTDGSTPKYLPQTTDSGIKTSNLYVRKKYIQSTCNINTYQPTYSSNLVTTDQYNSFQNFTYTNGVYDPPPSQEGACGVESIGQNLNMFQTGSYSGRNVVEGFDSGVTITPSPPTSMPTSSGSSTTPPFGQIPGFKPNICNSLSKPDCINEIQTNLSALRDYKVSVDANVNNQIYKNYTNLQNEIFNEFIVKYNEINMNAGYDPIDNAGNLLTQNYDKTLLSGMIYDIKQNMMGENTKNILINLFTAAIFVGILALAP